MAFAIRRRPPPPCTNFQTNFTPLFSFAIESLVHMGQFLQDGKNDQSLSKKNIIIKSSFNWFKVDIHQQLQPLTANYLAMFKVISTTIYT